MPWLRLFVALPAPPAAMFLIRRQPTEAMLAEKAMDGRYTKSEYKGDIPGMGAFHGLGYNGFDNVSQKFVSFWLDNMGTGIMEGEGTLSPDGRTMTWTFEYNCPINKRPATNIVSGSPP